MDLLLLAIPTGFIQAAQLLLSLSILVFVHEMGHFLAAKAFGIKVDKFYIFFDAGGKKLFSFKKGETEYGVGWLPIGGYVKIAGMIDESMDKDQMKGEPQPWEFRSKPVWQRFIVMIGGIVMNVIFGILFYTLYVHSYEKEYIPLAELRDGIYAFEEGRNIGLQTGDQIIEVNGKEIERWQDVAGMKILFGGEYTVLRDGQEVNIELPSMVKVSGPVLSKLHQDVYVDSVMAGSAADKYGLMSGDKIEAVNGEPIYNFGHMAELLRNGANRANNPKREITVAVNREGKPLELDARLSSAGTLGFIVSLADSNYYQAVPYSFGQSIKYGTKEAFSALVVNAVGLGKIFQGEVKARDSVMSPIGIATLFAPKWDWAGFWKLTALISMILAFMNILPIPALDGGHIMFLGYEAIRGKPASEKVMEKAQILGIIIVLALMIFSFGNDILKLFGI